jgi:four helix bundle protein
MRERSGFEKLEVYLLSEQLADAIWRCVRKWKNLERDTIGKQIVRAADSIGANIAEGYGRESTLDSRRFVRIAIGSLYETKHWLRRAYARDLLTKQEVNELRPMMDRMLPLLNGYRRSIGRPRISSPTPDLRPPTHE